MTYVFLPKPITTYSIPVRVLDLSAHVCLLVRIVAAVVVAVANEGQGDAAQLAPGLGTPAIKSLHLVLILQFPIMFSLYKKGQTFPQNG